jgi:hypothetical protein
LACAGPLRSVDFRLFRRPARPQTQQEFDEDLLGKRK